MKEKNQTKTTDIQELLQDGWSLVATLEVVRPRAQVEAEADDVGIESAFWLLTKSVLNDYTRTPGKAIL
jgi:hypothetical protein